MGITFTVLIVGWLPEVRLLVYDGMCAIYRTHVLYYRSFGITLTLPRMG